MGLVNINYNKDNFLIKYINFLKMY